MGKNMRSDRSQTDRRSFLAGAGKLAVVVPPTMTVLLSTSLTSPAIAASGAGSTTFFGEGGDNGNRGAGNNGDNGNHGAGNNGDNGNHGVGNNGNGNNGNGNNGRGRG